MEQMNINPEIKIDIDFRNENLPESARQLEPVVFKEAGSFCCLLGPAPETGILGRGNTPEEAVIDWDMQVQKLIQNRPENDPVAQYVIDTLGTKKGDVW